MQPLFALNIEDDLSVFTSGTPVLTPAQKSVAVALLSSIDAAEVSLLRVAPGMGRTTIMQAVRVQTGGSFIVARQCLKLLSKQADTIQETFFDVVDLALDRNTSVFIDDLHLIIEGLSRYNYKYADPIDSTLTAVADDAMRQGKKLIFGVRGKNDPSALTHRAITSEMEAFKPEDYAQIAEHYLGSPARRIDMVKVHGFAPALTAYQIRDACLWLGLRYATPDTAALIQYLCSRNLSSHVRPSKVVNCQQSGQKGTDDVIEELETSIALPFCRVSRSIHSQPPTARPAGSVTTVSRANRCATSRFKEPTATRITNSRSMLYRIGQNTSRPTLASANITLQQRERMRGKGISQPVSRSIR